MKANYKKNKRIKNNETKSGNNFLNIETLDTKDIETIDLKEEKTVIEKESKNEAKLEEVVPEITEEVVLLKRGFTDKQKIEVWENYFGLSKSWPDAFGRVVYRDNFVCSHIFPLEKGGETKINNGIPLHPDSHSEKGDKLTGMVNNKPFEIKGNVTKGQLYVAGLIKSR